MDVEHMYVLESTFLNNTLPLRMVMSFKVSREHWLNALKYLHNLKTTICKTLSAKVDVHLQDCLLQNPFF